MNKKIPISKPYLDNSAKKNLNDAIKTNWISSQGKYIKLFESAFEKFNDSKYCVAVSNGSVALILALKAIKLSYGDKVIVPNITFSATINSIINIGAKPIIVDINENNWTINIDEIEKNINKNTKAIVLVHVYGNVADVKKVNYLAKKYNLKIVEDCAEAHGANYKGRKVGNFSDVGCFSFYANKIFTTGEGGICCTNNKKIFNRLKLLRDQGLNIKKFNNRSIKKYYCEDYGFNFRMTNLQAAIGVSQIRNSKKILNKRKLIDKYYKKYLKKNNFISYPVNKKNINSVNWLFTIQIKKNIINLIRYLSKNGIETRPIFYPFNKTKIYKKYIKKNNRYNNSNKLFRSGISLPTFHNIKEIQIKHICNLINSYCSEQK